MSPGAATYGGARTTLRRARVAIAVASLVAPLVAHAQPAGDDKPADRPSVPTPPRPTEGDVTLEYVRGPQTAACPDEAALRERAGDAFDFHDPFVPNGQRASSHMRVEIERAAQGFRGKVLIVDAEGRELATSIEEHASCDALVWVLGHRVALAVLRKRPESPIAPPPSPSIAPPETAPPPPPVLVCDAKCAETIASHLAERAAPPVSLTILAGASMTAGWTADVGPGMWAGLAVRHGWLSIAAEARGTFPARALQLDSTRTADVATLSLAVLPCATWRVLSGCAVAEVGSYTLLVPSSTTPTVNDALVSLGARAAVDIPLGAGFSLRAFAELALHPYLPIFTVRLTSAPSSPIERWVTPVASGLLGLGVGWSP